MKILYRGFLYEAWDINQIKQKFGKEVEEYLKKYNDNTPVDEYFARILNIDPSADKKYLGAITKWALEKRPEDLESQIGEYLNRFKTLLDANPGKLGGISKDIAKGKLSLDQFKSLVNEWSDKLSGGVSKEAQKISEKVGDFKKFNENEDYVTYEVMSRKPTTLVVG